MTATTEVGLKTLEDLFIQELEEMYDAEYRIGKLLSSVTKSARCWKLKKTILYHQLETEGHIMKLERIFHCLVRRTTGKTGKVIIGLVDEGGEIAKKFAGSSDIDGLLILFLLKVERHEIEAYERLLEWAMLLRNPTAAELLEEILAEEIAAAQTLGELARSFSEAQKSGEMNCKDDMEDSRKAC